MKSLGSQVAAVSIQGVSAEGASLFVIQAELTAHVSKLLAATLEVVSVLCLDGILNGTRHGVVGTQDIALDQLDLTCGIALEATAASSRTTDLRSCFPCLGRCGLCAGHRRASILVLWVLKIVSSVLVVSVEGWGVVGVVIGIGFCQAVAVILSSRRVRVRVVKGALVGTGRVGMQQRALDLLIRLMLVVILRLPPVSHLFVHL